MAKPKIIRIIIYSKLLIWDSPYSVFPGFRCIPIACKSTFLSSKRHTRKNENADKCKYRFSVKTSLAVFPFRLCGLQSDLVWLSH